MGHSSHILLPHTFQPALVHSCHSHTQEVYSTLERREHFTRSAGALEQKACTTEARRNLPYTLASVSKCEEAVMLTKISSYPSREEGVWATEHLQRPREYDKTSRSKTGVRQTLPDDGSALVMY